MARKTMLLQNLLFFLAFLVMGSESKCQDQTHFATTLTKSFSYLNYEDNENCLIQIQPSSSFLIGYYLEVIWTKFDVEGNMPDCTQDSAEIFLTRSAKSIGKYCSSNLSKDKLFNMYSKDGYASIRFKSDGSGKRTGFQISYRLRSYSYSFLGTYGKDTCYFDEESSFHGLFYPSGWPKGYTNGSLGFCYHKFSVAKGKGFRIAVMDLDLRKMYSICNAQNDFFQIKVSSTSLNSALSVLLYANSLTAMHCGSFHPGFFLGNNSYVYIYFNKPLGSYPDYSNRGFMVAYIFFDEVQKSDKEKDNDNAVTLWASIGGAAGLITIVGIIAGVRAKGGDFTLCHNEININRK